MVDEDTRATLEDDLKQYIRDISMFPKGCSEEEERALACRIQQGDKEARDHLVNCNLALVIFHARKWRFHPPVTLLDLIAAGNEGLMTAANKFEPSKGRFTTYATVWIRQAMGRAYPELSRTITLPVHYAEQVLKLQRLMDHLRVTLGIEKPELEDLADALYPDLDDEVRLPKTQELLYWSQSVLSLDQNERDDEHDPFYLGDTLENSTFPTQDTYVEQVGVCEQVKGALATLTPRQREFIKLYYGAGEENLKKCSVEYMGLTRERGRQIFDEALKRMRAYQYRWLIPAS